MKKVEYTEQQKELIKKYSLLPGRDLLYEQAEGVGFMLERPYTLLAFQTGLGKTFTACTAMQHILNKLSSVKGIILLPNKAIKIFKKELSLFGHEVGDSVGIMWSQEVDYDIDKNRVFLISHSMLKKYSNVVRNIRSKYPVVCAIDEGHILQADKSSQRLLLDELRPLMNVVWVLTATPLLNHIMGLYNIIDWIVPGFYKNKSAFMNKYCTWHFETVYLKDGGGKKRKVPEIDSVSNHKQLKIDLGNIMIMRQKSYKIEFGFFPIDLNDSEFELYDKVGEGFFSAEKKEMSARMHELQRLVDNSLDDKICPVGITSKEDMFINLITEMFKKGISAVVYVDYIDTLNRLKQILAEKKDSIGLNNVFEISGSVEQEDRFAVEDAITQRDIVLITKAGTESLNLQKCSTLIFYDIPYSIGTILQAIGRVTRVNTEFDVQYVAILYTRGTIDEYKYKLFQSHAQVIKDVIGSDANLPPQLDKVESYMYNSLRDKLLWRYKSGVIKLLGHVKRTIKSNFKVISPDSYTGKGKFNHVLNLSSESIQGVVSSDKFNPDSNLLSIKDKYPSVFRTKYIDLILKHNDFILMFYNELITKGSKILIVDNSYGVGKLVQSVLVENAEIYVEHYMIGNPGKKGR